MRISINILRKYIVALTECVRQITFSLHITQELRVGFHS
jgi:hypothetical protein